jgi:hypothetical protein
MRENDEEMGDQREREIERIAYDCMMGDVEKVKLGKEVAE